MSTMTQCPACGGLLVDHCDSAGTGRDCPWMKCRNVKCGGVFDTNRGIGTANDPTGVRDPSTKRTRVIRMIRRDTGVWVDRDE